MRRLFLPLCLALAACTPAPQPEQPSRAATSQPGLPPVKSFAAPHPVQPTRSNGDIARDFLALAFQLESGRNLPVLTRFEGPITVRVLGAAPPSLTADLGRLLHRLRNEAGLNIALTTRDDAGITIQPVSRADIRRQLPQAACFVAPNVSSLAQYRLARRTSVVNWTLLRERKRLAIFLPNDSSPQEMRDCLHEELAQALGPLNDLYRLPDSVFNDDNVHTVLTGFDMLILRAYYAPDLRNGMTRAEVAARLPRLLARLNPAGEGRATRAPGRTPRVWIEAIQTALGPGAGPAERRKSAQRALQIASAMGWTDHRRAFSHYALGRLTQPIDADAALREFQAADRFYAATPGTELHRAYVAAQLAAHAIGRGDAARAGQLVDARIDTAARHENAALLATLLMLRAEALDMAGRAGEGQAVRLDSLGWARYGFGADWAVRAKMREIESLNPYKG